MDTLSSSSVLSNAVKQSAQRGVCLLYVCREIADSRLLRPDPSEIFLVLEWINYISMKFNRKNWFAKLVNCSMSSHGTTVESHLAREQLARTAVSASHHLPKKIN